MGKIETDEQFRSRHQIGLETDMSHNYFNEILGLFCGDPIFLEKMNNYFHKEDNLLNGASQEEIKSRALKAIREMPQYLDAVTRNDSDLTGLDFVTEKNKPLIKRLDEIVEEVRKLGAVSSFEGLNLLKLKQLAYESTVLIYGESKRETAKRRFHIEDRI